MVASFRFLLRRCSNAGEAKVDAKQPEKRAASGKITFSHCTMIIGRHNEPIKAITLQGIVLINRNILFFQEQKAKN